MKAGTGAQACRKVLNVLETRSLEANLGATCPKADLPSDSIVCYDVNTNIVQKANVFVGLFSYTRPYKILRCFMILYHHF